MRSNRLIFTFWGAVALNIVLSYITYGNYLLYPFALLSTWAHEMGHGLTAIMVGGDFLKMELYQNLGGVAYSTRPSSGLAPVFISAGGLLGPAVVGGVIIVMGSNHKMGRWVLEILAALLIASVIIWIRNPFGIVATLVLGLGLGLIGIYGSETVELCVVQFIGIRLCLESLSDVDYMFTKQFERNGQVMLSDTQLIAEHLFLPYWVWGGLIAAISFVILLLAFYVAWMRKS